MISFNIPKRDSAVVMTISFSILLQNFRQLSEEGFGNNIYRNSFPSTQSNSYSLNYVNSETLKDIKVQISSTKKNCFGPVCL